MALAYWSDKNIIPYLYIEDKNGVNIAVMPDVDFATWTPRVYNSADFKQIQVAVTANRTKIEDGYMHVAFSTVRSSL